MCDVVIDKSIVWTHVALLIKKCVWRCDIRNTCSICTSVQHSNSLHSMVTFSTYMSINCIVTMVTNTCLELITSYACDAFTVSVCVSVCVCVFVSVCGCMCVCLDVFSLLLCVTNVSLCVCVWQYFSVFLCLCLCVWGVKWTSDTCAVNIAYVACSQCSVPFEFMFNLLCYTVIYCVWLCLC